MCSSVHKSTSSYLHIQEGPTCMCLMMTIASVLIPHITLYHCALSSSCGIFHICATYAHMLPFNLLPQACSRLHFRFFSFYWLIFSQIYCGCNYFATTTSTVTMTLVTLLYSCYCYSVIIIILYKYCCHQQQLIFYDLIFYQLRHWWCFRLPSESSYGLEIGRILYLYKIGPFADFA